MDTVLDESRLNVAEDLCPIPYRSISIKQIIGRNPLSLTTILPLLHPDADLPIQHRKFPCTPGAQGDLLEIGMQQLREFRGDPGIDFVDIIGFEPDLGMFFIGVLCILEEHNAQAVFFDNTKGIFGLSLVMANGEFKTVNKGFNGYLDVQVKDTWNYFSEMHGF